MDLGCLSRPLKQGPYRQADVLAFLDRHLPTVDDERSRRWRIIMADDYSAHLSPAVFANADRAAMYASHMAAVSRLLLKRQTLTAIST